MSPDRIVIADDHPLFRAALRQTLVSEGAQIVVDEAADLGALLDRLADGSGCDLVLLDLNMPGMHGFSGLLLVRAEHPDVPVMIVSATEDARAVRRALELGASGYLGKSAGPAVIRHAIARVLGGEVHVPEGVSLAGADPDSALTRRLASLTPQQLRVLMMLGEGLMNKQVAHELRISEATVKAHVSAILQKLDVDSRTQAVIAAARIERGEFEALIDAGRPRAS